MQFIPEHIITGAHAVLSGCMTSEGLLASVNEGNNYRALFTRDAALNALGLLFTGDEKLVEPLLAQLKMLRKLQGEQGQIPSNFTIGQGEVKHVSFGTLTPKFDGPSWYVIAVCTLIKQGKTQPQEWRESVEKALALLSALEYNEKGLITVPLGSDWADEYICQGYVLHVQVLRCWALKLAGEVFENDVFRAKSVQVKEQIDENFFHSEGNSRYLIASFDPTERLEFFDCASNVLYAFIFPNSAQSQRILDYMEDQFLSKGQFPPAFSPTIFEGDPLWDRLRKFHLFEFKNEPGQYHNGGVWWIWLGWYSLTLRANGRTLSLTKLNRLTSEHLKGKTAFQFKEFIDHTGEEGGQPNMGFSSAGIVMIDYVAKEE